ncbi:uncharacterized protein LOC141613915 [Silene latifolia]|uniref:uncharacterized protein LOC141613915 n=1 Tax=Silene latifolia TaxID=37657 RepID=UPI003D7808E5
MSDPISEAVKVVAGPLKTLVVDRIIGYVKFINSYDDNMNVLVDQLEKLCVKKLDLDAKVMEGKDRLRVMRRETANWLENFIKLIEGEEMKKLMKEERVTKIVVRVIERRVLKKLWKEDREIFNIVVDVVKKKCSHQEVGEGEIVDAEKDADYQKVAKIASDIIKDITEEFKKFIKTDDAAVAVVKLLNDEDLKKLAKDGDEMAMILSKAEGIIRKKIEHNDHDEEELLIPKHNEDVQSVDKSIIKENIGMWRKHMGRLTAFLDDENFKKGLPDGVKIGLEVMNALSKSSGPEQVEENNKPHRYCGWSVVRFEGYRHRHDMSELSETMVNIIKSMIAECPIGSVTRHKTANELEIIPSEFMEGLESREELLQKILIALQDDQVDIVGVFGMGGGGKTTLAKEIAYKKASLFDKAVVVEVSEAPNIKGIQDQIAEGINFPLDDVHTLAQRAQNLYNALKSEKKKILIILDNVWKKLKLDEVGIPRKSAKDSCCKILITTRERQVCTVMDIQDANIFEVGLLNEREALNLFENQTKTKVDSGEFKTVADRLLRKCGGLPLAIVTLGSALRGKNLAMWCHFAETSEKPISSQVSTQYREAYSILETSYKLIDIEVKREFFFLVCLSPLDSAITVDDLMKYGTGLDLFQRVNGLSEAMEQASAWANELISSSLLLKGDFDGQVKIHDVVRASAISFADKGKDGLTLVESIPRWMCPETFEKFTSISLMSGDDFSQLCGVNAPMLEILLLKGNISSTSLSSNFFEGMKNLKVLSLSNMNFNMGLPESMGELKCLKTLHLHDCKLKDIKLIGKLVNLLVLSLRGSTLEELAIEIGELCKLRLLDMGGCRGMKSIPSNILPRLSHLEGLYMYNGFDGWASPNGELVDGGGYKQASGSELGTLSHLNVLEMEVSNAEQLLTINKGQLVEKLGKFKIRVGHYNKSDEDVSAFRYILQLGCIDVSQCNWLRVLVDKTDCLLVNGTNRRTENFVPQLDGDGSKNLKYLEVVYSTSKFIVSSNELNESPAFTHLETLRLGHLHSLEMIYDGNAPAGVFLNLRYLTLWKLPELKYGLPALNTLNLSEVSVKECQSLKFIVNDDASTATSERDIVEFPVLKLLDLYDVKSLSSVLWQSDSESEDRPFFNAKSTFQSLEQLRLWVNEIVVTLWSKACDISSFQNLKILDIFMCKKLKSLGSPSIFSALVLLEKLSIRSCGNLHEVITKETEGNEVREHVIAFPRLEHLGLKNLDSLERFYGGTYKLEFPNLKSVKLSNAVSLTNFDGSQKSTTFFSDKINFPSLEELKVRRVSEQVVRLWNWPSSGLQEESQSESGNITLNPVPNLRELKLGLINGSTYVPDFVSRKLSKLTVMDFSNIKTLFSNFAVNREVFWTYSQLPKLENLSVSECDSLEKLFENEDGNGAIVLCGRLTEIKLKRTSKLKMLPLHLLKNLCTLSLTDLKWKYAFSADLFIKGREQLQQLENLVIDKCEEMEVIIMDELVVDGDDRVYSFPRLKSMMLQDSNITNLASKPGSVLQFGSLERFEITSCHKIQSFYSGSFTAPNLKEVVLWECDNLQYFVSEKMKDVQELPSLEGVVIGDCRKILSFSSEALVAPKLEYVRLLNCCEMTCFSPGDPNNNDILDLPSLECISIEKCRGMQSFSSGGINAPNLRKLVVDKEDFSTRANEEMQKLSMELHKLHRRGDDDDDDDDDDYDDDDDDDEEEEEGEEEEDDQEGEDEDMNGNGDGEMEERQTDGSEGSQDEESTEGDEGSTEGDEESTEGSDGSQE